VLRTTVGGCCVWEDVWCAAKCVQSVPSMLCACHILRQCLTLAWVARGLWARHPSDPPSHAQPLSCPRLHPSMLTVAQQQQQQQLLLPCPCLQADVACGSVVSGLGSLHANMSGRLGSARSPSDPPAFRPGSLDAHTLTPRGRKLGTHAHALHAPPPPKQANRPPQPPPRMGRWLTAPLHQGQHTTVANGGQPFHPECPV